ncbi:F-box/kelch-repeat protein At3g23880-like [Papaver somniferum]|uniref:F-box/kelch-repeat protein At3g23880-like n=1 Tax=Papaver somniferum TaxID=3469 RepID=UPI000E70596A|nr:F-box/kelch-repeat protein At3g23880-like [Papaver somniferum]
MVNIPEDIMLDILVRLPVKSIGRFRCVNKAWSNLLKDTKFVKMHLKHAVEMNKLSLMLRQDSDSIKTIGYNLSLSTDNGLVNVDYPLKYETRGVQCLGYCDGLVWFVCEGWLATSHVCIWNPATNEYKELPVTPPESLNGMRRFECGFGYDYEIEDFKVVSLMSCDSFEGFWSEVQVYTLGSNSWRGIGKIPYDVYDPMADMARVPVNGALHWIVVRTTGASSVIISFDLAQEIIQEIALPN